MSITQSFQLKISVVVFHNNLIALFVSREWSQWSAMACLVSDERWDLMHVVPGIGKIFSHASRHSQAGPFYVVCLLVVGATVRNLLLIRSCLDDLNQLTDKLQCTKRGQVWTSSWASSFVQYEVGRAYHSFSCPCTAHAQCPMKLSEMTNSSTPCLANMAISFLVTVTVVVNNKTSLCRNYRDLFVAGFDVPCSTILEFINVLSMFIKDHFTASLNCCCQGSAVSGVSADFKPGTELGVWADFKTGPESGVWADSKPGPESGVWADSKTVCVSVGTSPLVPDFGF